MTLFWDIVGGMKNEMCIFVGVAGTVNILLWTESIEHHMMCRNDFFFLQKMLINNQKVILLRNKSLNTV